MEKGKKRLTIGEAKDEMLRLYRENGFLSQAQFDRIIGDSDIDEAGFLSCLAFLTSSHIELADSQGQEEEIKEEDREESGKPDPDAVRSEADGSGYDSGTTSLDMYFADIGRYPLLTRDEEIELSKRIKAGDEDARERLIDSNLRLVASIASHYRRLDNSLTYQDLISYGNSGLITAAGKYDYTKGCRFSTYASFWIRQAISRSIALYGHQIKIPVYIAGALQKIKAVSAKLTLKLNRDPTYAEIAGEMGEGYTPGKVESILSYDSPVISLDKPTGKDEDGRLGDLIADESTSADFSSFKSEDISYALSMLTPRERRLVEYRFGLSNQSPHTLEETGKLIDITRERARQIIAEALGKMKKTLSKSDNE